jgi:hypothetical protein
VATVEANPKGAFPGAGLGQINGGKSSSGVGLKSTRRERASCIIRRPTGRPTGRPGRKPRLVPSLVAAMGNGWDWRGRFAPKRSASCCFYGAYGRVLIPPFGGSNPSTPANSSVADGPPFALLRQTFGTRVAALTVARPYWKSATRSPP